VLAALLALYPVRLLVLGYALWETRRVAYAVIKTMFHTSTDGLFLQRLMTVAPASVLVAGLFVAVHVLGARIIERRAVDELWLDGAARTGALAFAGGGALVITVFGAMAAQGGVTFETFAGLSHLPAMFLIFATAALAEELIFRAVIFRISEICVGTAAASAMSALLFTLAHLGNSGIAPLAVLSIFLGGAACALLYRLTGTLWAPFGAHFGWNFMQGAVLGRPVSGHRALGAFSFALHGPSWATGGAFGPENTVYAVALLAVMVIALARRAWRQRIFVPARFVLSAGTACRAARV
jgi:hypothetical protein